MSIYISTNIVFLSNQKENLSKLKDFILDLKANSVIFKEALGLSGLENIEFYWLDFYENGEIETNDSKQVVFKGDYYIDHECEPNFMEIASEPDTYTKEEARKIFINLLTSKYVYQDDALTQEEAEKLTTEELFDLVDSAEFYDDDDDEIYLVVKEVSYV